MNILFFVVYAYMDKMFQNLYHRIIVFCLDFSWNSVCGG